MGKYVILCSCSWLYKVLKTKDKAHNLIQDTICILSLSYLFKQRPVRAGQVLLQETTEDARGEAGRVGKTGLVMVIECQVEEIQKNQR